MTVPSSGGSTGNLGRRWAQFTQLNGGMKRGSTNIRNAAASGPIDAGRLHALMEDLKDGDGKLSQALDVPGFDGKAKAETNNPSYVIADEIGVERAALLAVIEWIRDNVPVSGRSMVNFGIVDRSVTTAQSAALLPILDTFIATIE